MFNFLRSPAERLGIDGELHPIDLQWPRLGRRTIILARGRCVFGAFSAMGVGGAARRAAYLFAQTHAPFETTGRLILRRGGRFEVWWWDRDWVLTQLARAGVAGPVRILPDPYVQTPAQGGRVIAAKNGFDVQFWRDGALLASSWRRRAPTGADWSDFARGIGTPIEPPAAAVAAEAPPWRLPIAALSPIPQDASIAGWTAAALAALLLGVCAYYGIEDARFSVAIHQTQRALQAERHTPGRAHEAELQAAGLLALRRLAGAPDPLTLADEAESILQPFGYTLDAFDIDRRRVRLILPLDAIEDVEPLAVELEGSPYFSQVAARRDGEAIVIEMAIEGSVPQI